MSIYEPYRGIKRVLFYVWLILVAVWVLFPFFWAVENSLKTTEQTFTRGAFLPWIQYQPTLGSWQTVISDPAAIRALVNSVVISIATTLIVLVLGTPAAYALARHEFRPMTGRDIAVWFLTQRVLPPAVVLVPYFVLMVHLRLIDTQIGLILVYVAVTLPFGVVIMRDVFRTSPWSWRRRRSSMGPTTSGFSAGSASLSRSTGSSRPRSSCSRSTGMRRSWRARSPRASRRRCRSSS